MAALLIHGLLLRGPFYQVVFCGAMVLVRAIVSSHTAWYRCLTHSCVGSGLLVEKGGEGTVFGHAEFTW